MVAVWTSCSNRRDSPIQAGETLPELVMKTFCLMGVVAAMMGAPSATALAQTYPNQRVTIVVPFTAGSITDGLARILAEKLADIWNQQVIVENRPGIPGTTGVARATPDGYTLMLTSNGHTIAGAIAKGLQYD